MKNQANGLWLLLNAYSNLQLSWFGFIFCYCKILQLRITLIFHDLQSHQFWNLVIRNLLCEKLSNRLFLTIYIGHIRNFVKICNNLWRIIFHQLLHKNIVNGAINLWPLFQALFNLILNQYLLLNCCGYKRNNFLP